MTPILFIDLETTGLDPSICAPISIAAVMLAGPHHDKRFHARMRPFVGATISPYAMQVNGYDPTAIMSWPDPQEVCEQFREWLDIVAPGESVQAAGHYFRFDEGFLREWITRHIDAAYYGNVFAAKYIDTIDIVKATWPDWKSRWQNCKLTTQYEAHFGRTLTDAHTELADCLASRDLFLHCDKHSKEPRYADYHSTLSYALP